MAADDAGADAGRRRPRARTVLVGVCGGIAIYKTVELVRSLVKEGFAPTVVTTDAAKRFVMPLTFAAVSQGPVLDDEHVVAAERRLVPAHRRRPAGAM